MCYIFSAWCPQSYREGEAQHSRLSISSQSVPEVAKNFFCMEENVLVVSDYYCEHFVRFGISIKRNLGFVCRNRMRALIDL